MRNKEIILVFANNDYLEVLLNWISWVESLNILNYKIIALDNKLYEYLINKNIKTIYKPCKLELGKLWIHRVEVIKEFLDKGCDVIHSDADAVWLKNPISELNIKDSDLIFSQGTFWPSNIYDIWGFVLCCGFFKIKSNKKTRLFINKWLETVKIVQDDQISLNNLLFEDELIWKEQQYYELNFKGKKIKCFEENINGETRNGLKVSLLSHNKFQRIYENNERAFVLHPISEKKSNSILEVLFNTKCIFSER